MKKILLAVLSLSLVSCASNPVLNDFQSEVSAAGILKTPDLKTKTDNIVNPFLISGRSPGMMIGIINHGNKQIFSYGNTEYRGNKKPDL